MSYERRRFRVTARTFARIRFGRSSAGHSHDTRANVRSVAMAMAIAAILLAVFNSGEMQAFARDLPVNGFTDVLVEGADKWHEMMLDLGPAQLRPIVRDAFSAIRSATW